MFAHQDVLVDRLFNLSFVLHAEYYCAVTQSDALFYLSFPRFASGLQARLQQALHLPPPPLHVHLHLPHLVTGCVLTQAGPHLYPTLMAKTCPPLPSRVLVAVLS